MQTWLLIFALFPFASIPTPRVLDAELAIDLLEAEPQLVTPTGVAVDRRGRIFVVESHTHFRPVDYPGPKADRVLVFIDDDGDGSIDRRKIFFEGTRATMNVGVHPDGSVYVGTRNEVFRLRDKDGDGVSDEQTPIARLETRGFYPHNGLSGFAFDPAGNVYFGLGENLGADYRLVGSDGSSFSGGGEGGSVVRCQADGGKLLRLATGFWNPFHLCLDRYERLFVVDNDPDSRPPCRLLHIVAGGDYGYRYRNGRKGLNPFTAWNGELPGTLPMTAGVGEAPSGVIAYESDGLPEKFRGVLLATSWGDHRIEMFRLREAGASIKSQPETLVQGGEDFRPVGIALCPDGSLVLTDWVKKSYELHQHGRLWRIRSAKKSSVQRPQDDLAAARSPHRPLREAADQSLAASSDGKGALRSLAMEDRDSAIRASAIERLILAGAVDAPFIGQVHRDADPNVRALAARLLPDSLMNASDWLRDPSPAVQAEALRRLRGAEHRSELVRRLGEADPFVRHAAAEGLKASSGVEDWIALFREMGRSAEERLMLAVLLRESQSPAARIVLDECLTDPDPRLRFAGVQWIAEQRLKDRRSDVEKILSGESATREVFEACLVALALLDGRDVAGSFDVVGGQAYIARILTEGKASPTVLRRCLRTLRPSDPALTLDRLRGWISSSDPVLRVEAIRSLRENKSPGREDLLRSIAGDADVDVTLRAEALAGLEASQSASQRLLVDAATGADPVLAGQALQSLIGAPLEPSNRSKLVGSLGKSNRIEQLQRALGTTGNGEGSPNLTDVDAWLLRADGPSDAKEGERVFFHPKGPGCYRCHQVDGRGGEIGPDLSTTGRMLDRRRLLDSILQPSREMAPKFVPWLVAKKDGRLVQGVLLSESPAGDAVYGTSKGEQVSVAHQEVEQRSPLSVSIMPADLARTMTMQQLRDLLAYLQERR